MIKFKHLYQTVFSLIIIIAAACPEIMSAENEGGDIIQYSSKKWLSGYYKDITGELIVYHSPQPDATEALLVRSLDRRRHIEWETEPVPEDFTGESAEFIWLAAIDVNREECHKFDLFINDEEILTFSNPLDSVDKEILYEGKYGIELLFDAVDVDRHGDLMGYWFLKVPVSKYGKGDPLAVRVAGESAGSRSWFMVFMNRLESKVELFSEQALLRDPEKRKQSLRIDLIHIDDPKSAVIYAGEDRIASNLKLGYNTFQLSVPAVEEEQDFTVNIEVDGRERISKTYRLKPVRQWEIYLLHHSHVDIGYTHVQDEVERIQWDHLENSIKIAEGSQDFPPESQFKWNSEVMWPVESYLRNADSEKKKKLVEAIRKGWIGLDGMYANELTGICRPEELYKLFEYAKDFPGNNNFDYNDPRVEAAMITDIPGYAWGIVPAMAQNGIKYFSIGTNTGHRIGHIISEWGDRPFYWVSPSGQEKVLCLVEGKGYSLFHTGLGYTRLEKRLKERPLFDYLSELNASDYPYDMVSLRYSIGSDNGPPDPLLPESVREWNEKYLSPKIIISTTAQFFKELESRYGEDFPEVKGDFTGHWEDGAYSTARESALNRNAAEKLVQAEILWTMKDIENYPSDKFEEAWRNILLYDEHTWGSWNSISEPYVDFTIQQWEKKRTFVQNSERLSNELLDSALETGDNALPENRAIDVYNTNSWSRTDVVYLPESISGEGDRIRDEQGNYLPSQRLSSGELAVLVKDIPAMGMKRFLIEDGDDESNDRVVVENDFISNGILSVKIDDNTGNISSIRDESTGTEYVRTSDDLKFNGYYYVPGRDPKEKETVSNVRISIKDNGPLIGSLIIESDAPGSNSLKREIRLFNGIDRIDIINTVDKKDVYDPEGVHFAYPFNIPDGQVRIDLAWGMFRPEYDQLKGANKNYFSAQRWVDVSNDENGVTMALVDAPLIEVGKITNDPIVVGWKEQAENSQTILSYVMNNYWETNYKASQGGNAVFRYSLLPHRQFNTGDAKRFGIERSQPLIAVQSSENTPVKDSFLSLSNKNIVLTSMKPIRKNKKALLVRLFNTSEKEETTTIEWKGIKHGAVSPYFPFSDDIGLISDRITLKPFEVITLYVELK